MSRSLRRGSIAALAALAIASLSSCATGNNAETLEIKPDNVSATLSPTVTLNNIVVVTDKASGEHTGPASVVVNIANNGTEPAELQSVAVAGSGNAVLTDEKGAPLSAIVIPGGRSVAIGGQGNPTAQVASATLHVGGYAPVVFTFKGGKVETEAAVTSDLSFYKGYGPVTAPSTSPATSPAAVPTKAGASPSASGAATPGATGTATAGGAATGSTAPSAGTTTAAAGH